MYLIRNVELLFINNNYKLLFIIYQVIDEFWQALTLNHEFVVFAGDAVMVIKCYSVL